MDDHVMHTYRRREPVFVSGSGATLTDEDGAVWLDLLGGIAVSALGHAHPRLTAALTEQVGQLLHVSNLFRHPHTEAVADALAERTGMAAAFFCNSGAEANECALKLARKAQREAGHPERTGFVALHGGFHGRTAGALSVTAQESYRAPFGPLLPCTFVAPEDADALRVALEAGPAALILEPVQGEGGLRVLSADFLRAARALCDATGTLLIHDEVQCGAGRTGRFLAGQHAGVTPDLATLAKPLAAGLPMGVCLASERYAGVLVPGDHGTTFGGGPLVCRAARVFLDELAGGLQEAVVARGAQLTGILDGLAAEHPGLVTARRGLGLMQGLVLPGRAAEACDRLFARGLLCTTAAGDVLRFLPPYVITADDLQRAAGILSETLTEMERAA